MLYLKKHPEEAKRKGQNSLKNLYKEFPETTVKYLSKIKTEFNRMDIVSTKEVVKKPKPNTKEIEIQHKKKLEEIELLLRFRLLTDIKSEV